MKLRIPSKKYSVTMFAMPDIAFLLLIFLILTASVDEYGNIELPAFEFAGETEYPQTVTINVDSNGVCGISGEYYDRTTFNNLLGNIPYASVIYLVADKKCPYSRIDGVLSDLQNADLFDVVLIMDETSRE